jgi:hypothetical protein
MLAAPNPDVIKPGPRIQIYSDELIVSTVIRYRKLNSDLLSARKQAEHDHFVKTGTKIKLPISEEEKRVNNEKRRVENLMYKRKINKKLQ